MKDNKKIDRLRSNEWRKNSSLYSILKNILLLVLIIILSTYMLDVVESFRKIVN